DDPYLVVAADKGTATFSDTANAISQAHDFWLDDAFASGGSAGYDHKKMGITARGGWEAVKRHFREMDWDIQSQPFTVVGCGDMSGDVFGNGMLLSEHIRLVAAFDHRDIFVDPDPDPARTFKERKRLFDMGRSSWQDYNTKLLSKGGMIFPRSSKSLTLTPEIQAVLDIKKARVSPLELINAILKANADLLWFGGIGTYVKQTGETDEEVGDRANDAVRITASELRVKVVGEGANLGMTQKARIAFGMFGGRINSDAIDNSAGVNSSDVEVNIKIALGAAVRAGKLTTPKRNALLAQMTDEVAALVLRNNYQQTLSLSLAEQRGLKETEFQGRFMTALEGRGLLDRHVEDLPDQVTLAERIEDGKPLTRPELAVVLAYAKITLFDDLIATDVPDDPYLARDLFRYFPVKMQKKYAGEIEGHRLRREIIATMLANSMINRGGPVFVHRTADQTGADVATIARAFAVVRDSFGMTALNGAIDALDTRISGDLQLALYTRVQDLLWQLAPWFIRQMAPGVSLEAEIGRFSKGIGALVKSLAKGLPADLLALRDEDREALVGAGVDDDTASRLANIPHLVRAPDIIQVSETTGASVANAAKAYFSIGDQFGTARLVRAAEQIEAADYYDRVALSRALDGVAEAQRRIAMEAVGDGKDGITKWLAAKGAKATGTRDSVAAIADDATLTVSKVTVASALLRDLAPA
ncbi:MAG: NAD-glutamate dehydrogenase domain-containing protein, partial [Pseudomonadota bacterium]